MHTSRGGDLEARFIRWCQTPGWGDVFVFLARHPGAALEDQLTVLLADQARAWRSGTRRTVDEYLAKLPTLRTRPDLLAQLVCEEYGYRQELGEAVSSQDYLTRFPELSGHLDALTLQATPPDQKPPRDDEFASTILRPASDQTSLSPSPTAASSAAGQIGDYEILREIARGGMGVVYQARDRRLGRIAAVKLIRSGEFAHEEEVRRFRAEAQAAAALDHPGIVPVFEVGQQGQQHFMAMAFIDGHSLWQLVKEAPLAPRQAAQLMQQVTSAMAYAHGQGIVHRDLKPQNILLTKEGQPKVTDFGLAKSQTGDANLTATGDVLGTPSYMPPEQATGKMSAVGPLSDIYSLGATLYCLLTGRPPFQAANPLETLLQVVEQEPVPPRQLNASIPRDLETICLKCLQKDPAKRYASAQHLADDLGRYLRDEPILARPVSGLERFRRWCRRNKLVAATSLLALVSLMGVTAVGAWTVLRETRLAAEKSVQLARRELQVQQLVTAAEEARGTGEVDKAAQLLSSARGRLAEGKIRSALEIDLQRRFEDVSAQISARNVRQEEDARYQEFQRLVDEMRFHQNLQFPGEPNASPQTAREQGIAALAIYGLDQPNARLSLPSVTTDERRSVIQTACFEVFVSLAMIELRAGDHQTDAKGADHTRTALQWLTAARQFPFTSKFLPEMEARAWQNLGDTEQANRAMEMAESITPTLALEFYLMGQEERANGKLDSAIDRYSECLAVDPQYFWALQNVGLCHLRQGRPEAAITAYTAAAALRPEEGICYLTRAVAFADLRLFKQALADLRRAETLQVRPYDLHLNRGGVYYGMGELDAAEREFLIAAEAQPNQAAPHLNLAWLDVLRSQRFRGSGQFEAALNCLNRSQASLDRVRQKSFDEANARRLQTSIREDLSAIQRELAEVDAPLEPLFGSEFNLSERLGQVVRLRAGGRPDDALRVCEMGLREFPDNPDLTRQRAELLFQTGSSPQAEAAWTTVLTLSGPTADAYRSRGLMRGMQGKYAEAIVDYSLALELEPSASMHVRRGWAYMLNATRLALADFHRAIDLQPKDPDSWNGRAYARLKLEDVAGAIQDAEQSLNLSRAQQATGADGWQNYFNSAAVLAPASARIAADDRIAPEEREQQVSRIRERSLFALDQAIRRAGENGARSLLHAIQSDKELDSLRQDAAFQERLLHLQSRISSK